MMSWNSSPCASTSNPPSAQYPVNIKWFTGPLQTPGTGGQPRSGGVGQGAIVGMYRPDGVSDGANTIQGVRTTSSSSGTWTTPDALSGVVNDPATQKSYMWNGNNPVAYSDPSGYAVGSHATMASFDAGTWVNGVDCDGAGCSAALELPDDGGGGQSDPAATPEGASAAGEAGGEVAKDSENSPEGEEEVEPPVQQAEDAKTENGKRVGGSTYLERQQAAVDQQLGVPANAPQISRNPRDTTYMFRTAPGHVPDTPPNRSMLRIAAARGTIFRQMGPTVRKAWISPTGLEWWVTQRGNIIINGGMNLQPFFLRNP